MTDTYKLRGRIYSAGYTAKSLAKEIGMHPVTFSKKINGHAYFTVDEIYKICTVLQNISRSEIGEIFFREVV